MKIEIGIDVGGTFTDATVLDGEDGAVIAAFKLPSTRRDPGDAVLEALRRIGAEHDLSAAQVSHGTTVGTNALIERKGARTALVTTAGFADVIELRRQDRPELYRWDVRVTAPLVPHELRFEAAERLDHTGVVVRPLGNLDALVRDLLAAAPDAVAISCLHAYANPAHEIALKAAITEALPDAFVSASHEVCPELGEYERTSTTVVNAYIGPAVSRYLRRLEREAAAMGVRSLSIVKSNGGLTSPENASRFPAHLIESGPAAGIIAAAAYAGASQHRDLIAFDMGGTTAKASVVRDTRPSVGKEFLADRLVDGRDEGGHLIRSTVLDVVEIGAGGGSIAAIDAGGVLKVGPQSAGADPGPACYSRGGDRPTVTDAHAVIGTLAAETFEGTGVTFDRDRAVRVIADRIADPMGWDLSRAAYAILDLATARMAEMVRMATVRRGLDPRDFTLLASGGAGPLHAANVAAETGARAVVVPPLPGMFSALGATMGEIRHDLSKASLALIAQADHGAVAEGFEALRREAETLLAREVLSGTTRTFERYLDLRFAGQLFELRIPVGSAEQPLPPLSEVERRFRDAYREEFGFDLPNVAVQSVKLHVTARMQPDSSSVRVFREQAAHLRAPVPTRRQPFLGRDGTVFDIDVYRTGPVAGRVDGPALIEHAGSTIWIERGHVAEFCRDGSVKVEVGS
ncbi:hydantoinase/oxoprolinase family protein [Acuticoccus sediminis]|uniref:hydantoinase/oxoprolinase family protein n=1 Tax=Acuticoccus sediminis TaxID=2184697 RepID=UPI001CFCD77C|nr:hydantoinase/oxoprolinase family protein [Acuticoccus sediminis]